MGQKREFLKFCIGFRTALADGLMVPDSPQHMATEQFYRAEPGERLHLCHEGYVFAPAIFSPDWKQEYIYSYVYAPEEIWALYTQNLTPDGYGQEDYIFDTACWFRVCVKRKDGRVLAEEDEQAAKDLVAFFCEEVPYKEKEWLKPEIERTAARIVNKADHMLKLCLLADTHYTVNGTWEDTSYAIEEVAKRVGYDAVIHLGDMTDGMVSKELTTIYVRRMIHDLERCQVPVYITPGNHDSNYFRNRKNTFTAEEMRELYRLYGDAQNDGGFAGRRADGSLAGGQDKRGFPGGQDKHSFVDGRSVSYFVDLSDRKVRMIFLSSFDDQEKIRYGYTDGQINWLQEVLSDASAGTRFLIFSHEAPLAELDYWSFYTRNGERLVKVLEECNQREEYQVIGLFYGHTHGDYVFEECSFPMISTGCAKLEYLPELKPDGAVCPYREADKRRQELWDSLLVDFENQELYLIRFGAGEDRRVSFRKKRNRYFSSVNVMRGQRYPKIWAHRGASGHAPENTIPAFELALLMRADGIELDVQLSKDGVPVVIHDERLERLSEGSGWVNEYTLEELQELNVNKCFPAYGKVRIPTLEEVYDLVKKSDLTINLELKNSVVDYVGLEKKVLGLAEEKGLAERMVYSSFNHSSIRKIQRLLPGAKTAFLYADGFLDMAGYAARYGAYALHPSFDRVCREKDIIRRCHEKNIRVHVWAVNAREDFGEMKALGADAVITDYIERG